LWAGDNLMTLGDYAQASEAGEQLRVHAEIVKRLCRRGDIPAKQLHHTWLIRRADLDRFGGGYNPRPGRKRKARLRLFELEAR